MGDSEQLQSDVSLVPSSYRELAIEGELAVRLLRMEGSPQEWEVEYWPVVELHHKATDCPPALRALELVSRNCIHAGVVHSTSSCRGRLGDVPLHEPIRV